MEHTSVPSLFVMKKFFSKITVTFSAKMVLISEGVKYTPLRGGIPDG